MNLGDIVEHDERGIFDFGPLLIVAETDRCCE